LVSSFRRATRASILFGAAHRNDLAGSTLTEALAQFQRKKLLAINFRLLAKRAHRLRTRNKCAAKCWGLTAHRFRLIACRSVALDGVACPLEMSSTSFEPSVDKQTLEWRRPEAEPRVPLLSCVTLLSGFGGDSAGWRMGAYWPVRLKKVEGGVARVMRRRHFVPEDNGLSSPHERAKSLFAP
jgi:hypothetical protein